MQNPQVVVVAVVGQHQILQAAAAGVVLLQLVLGVAEGVAEEHWKMVEK